MKCTICKKKRPDRLLSPFIINGKALQSVCAICALELRNKAHGLPADEPFRGEVAQALYNETIKFDKAAASYSCHEIKRSVRQSKI